MRPTAFHAGCGTYGSRFPPLAAITLCPAADEPRDEEGRFAETPMACIVDSCSVPAVNVGARIAFALTASRLALAPLIIVAAHTTTNGRSIALLLAVGALTDLLDGAVARRANAITVSGSRLDSIADTAFYVAAGYAAIVLRRQELTEISPLVAAIIIIEVAGHIIVVRRFGRTASYHSWSAKLWGLLLPLGLIALFWRHSSALLGVAIACGIASNVEAVFITRILPRWQSDVPSVVHALRIRREARRLV